MIMINPWAGYDPDDIPDLNPHDKEEEYGCIAGIIGFCLSAAIFIALQAVILKLKLSDTIDTNMHMALILVNIIIFVIITICFMKLSFKIADYLYDRNKKKKL